MACPTCDHTMHAIGGGNFWCPRCGTLRNDRDFVPMLVTRCCEFDKVAGVMLSQAVYDLLPHWRRLGIEESIRRTKPADD